MTPPADSQNPPLSVHPATTVSVRPDGLSTPLALGLISLVWLILFVIQLTAPPNLLDNDQQKPAGYVADIVQNGAWIVQRDHTGDIASKPPVYYWLAALAALPSGQVTQFALYFPSGLAVLGLGLTIWGLGRSKFSGLAGMLAALFFVVSPAAIKQMALARTDALFGLFTFLAAMLAFRAWSRRRSWVFFWLMAALATLTKGPLGVALAAGGLLTAVWERPEKEATARSRRRLLQSQALGVALFVLLCGGWLWLAWSQLGNPVIDKLLGRELVGHALRGDGGQLPLSGLFKPTLYFLSRLAPWSLLACIGLWRVLRRPAEDRGERRFERFLACYFLCGLALFSIFPHQRPDHLFPLLPAAALLAGREASYWLAGRIRQRVMQSAAAGGLILAGIGIAQHAGRMKDRSVLRTLSLRELALQIRQQVGGRFPLIYADVPFGLQFYLGVFRQKTDLDLAAEALRGEGAAFVAVRDADALRKAVGLKPELFEVARSEADGKLFVSILSNRPRLEPTAHMTVVHENQVLVEMLGAHQIDARRRRIVFRAREPQGEIRLRNLRAEPTRLRVVIENTTPAIDHWLELPPRASASVPFGVARNAAATLRIGQLADCRSAWAQMEAFARDGTFRNLDFLVVNGDFTWETAWRFDQFNALARRWGVPVFPTIGNHDVVYRADAPLEPFMNRYGYAAQAFDCGPARCVLLNTGYKAVGAPQLAALDDLLAARPAPARTLVFQHVPPEALEEAHGFKQKSRKNSAERKAQLALLARHMVAGVYCGHRNRFEVVRETTPAGDVKVVTSGGGGEKSADKDYQQHWLLIEVDAAGVSETPQTIPAPTTAQYWLAHLKWREGYQVLRLLNALRRGGRLLTHLLGL